jgi:O-antigen/teichoic acid export membrane protein
MGLVKNLSATAVASLSGMAMQALTAPIYLMALSIPDFSRWLLATSIGAYLGLTVNGLFYSLMNKITIETHLENRDSANTLYADTLYIIGYISLPLVIFSVALFIFDRDSTASLIMAALATAGVNLTYVAMDANFRSMSKFAIGLNTLSASRLLDWLVGIAAAFVTRSPADSLFCVLLYRLSIVGISLYAIQRLDGAMKLNPGSPPPGLVAVARYAAASRGQMAIAATSSSSAMLPQIIASTVFPGHLSVYFNVYRTYMRLLASGATTATSAAWPILNRMYAERRASELERFFRVGLIVMVALASAGAVFLVASARFVFPVLFHAKVEILTSQISIIALAVTVSTLTIFCQSMFISTNMHSRSLYLNLALSTCLMVALFVASAALGIYALLFGLVLSEIIAFILAFRSADQSIKTWQRNQAA